MPVKRTSGYQLSQWEKSDKVLMNDFNRDNERIDAALKTQADALAAEKAARESAVAAEKAAREAAVAAESAARTSAVSRLGNCRIEQFTIYDDGQGNGVTLTFSAKPVVFLVFRMYTLLVCSGGDSGARTTGTALYSTPSASKVSMCEFMWNGFQATTNKLDPNGAIGTFQIVAFYAEDEK